MKLEKFFKILVDFWFPHTETDFILSYGK